MPLHPLNKNNTLLPDPSVGQRKHLNPPNSNINKAPKIPKRYIAPELLDEFKQAVEGSDLTKMGLVEILKETVPEAAQRCDQRNPERGRGEGGGESGR